MRCRHLLGLGFAYLLSVITLSIFSRHAADLLDPASMEDR